MQKSDRVPKGAGLHFRFNRFNLYIPCIGDAAYLDRGETFAMCLQQVDPKDIWLRFQEVERILGMYTGEIQATWSDIRPKEHGKTRKKTSLTEAQEKL